MRKNGFAGLSCQRSSKGRSLDAVLEESQGVLSPFFFPFGGFTLGKRSFGAVSYTHLDVYKRQVYQRIKW